MTALMDILPHIYVELVGETRELDADKKTLKRQYDALVQDFDRVQQSLTDLNQAKTSVEQNFMNKDAEVTRFTYTVSKLEQEVLSREEVSEQWWHLSSMEVIICLLHCV